METEKSKEITKLWGKRNHQASDEFVEYYMASFPTSKAAYTEEIMHAISLFGEYVLRLRPIRLAPEAVLVESMVDQLLEMYNTDKSESNPVTIFSNCLSKALNAKEDSTNYTKDEKIMNSEMRKTLEAFFTNKPKTLEVILINQRLSIPVVRKDALLLYIPNILKAIAMDVFGVPRRSAVKWMLLAWIHATKLIYYPWAATYHIIESKFDILKFSFRFLDFRGAEVETQKKLMDKILRERSPKHLYAGTHFNNKFTSPDSWKVFRTLYTLLHPEARTLETEDLIQAFKEVRASLLEEDETKLAEGFFKYCLDHIHRGAQYLPNDLFKDFLIIIQYSVIFIPVEVTDSTKIVNDRFRKGILKAKDDFKKFIQSWRIHLSQHPNVWHAVLEQYLISVSKTKNAQMGITQKLFQVLIDAMSNLLKDKNGKDATAMLKSFADRLEERHMTVAKTTMMVENLQSGWWTYHIEVLKKLISIHKPLSTIFPTQQDKSNLTPGSLDQNSEDEIDRFVDESYDNPKIWELLHRPQSLHEEKSVTTGANSDHAILERLLNAMGLDTVRMVQLWSQVSTDQHEHMRASLKASFKHGAFPAHILMPLPHHHNPVPTRPGSGGQAREEEGEEGVAEREEPSPHHHNPVPTRPGSGGQAREEEGEEGVAERGESPLRPVSPLTKEQEQSTLTRTVSAVTTPGKRPGRRVWGTALPMQSFEESPYQE